MVTISVQCGSPLLKGAKRGRGPWTISFKLLFPRLECVKATWALRSWRVDIGDVGPFFICDVCIVHNSPSFICVWTTQWGISISSLPHSRACRPLDDFLFFSELSAGHSDFNDSPCRLTCPSYSSTPSSSTLSIVTVDLVHPRHSWPVSTSMSFTRQYVERVILVRELSSWSWRIAALAAENLAAHLASLLFVDDPPPPPCRSGLAT